MDNHPKRKYKARSPQERANTPFIWKTDSPVWPDETWTTTKEELWCEEKAPKQKILTRADGTIFTKPTFKDFLTHEQLVKIFNEVDNTVFWDFCSALGDSIKEKYESLYVIAVQLNDELVRRGAAGYFWMVMSPELSSIFETAVAGFAPASSYELDEDYDPNLPRAQGIMSPTKVRYKGMVNHRWRLYDDAALNKEVILMGANDLAEEPQYYGKIVVSNFCC